jgi:hypothetical protein
MRAVVTVAVIQRPGAGGDDESAAPGEERSTPFDELPSMSYRAASSSSKAATACRVG